LWFSVLFSDCLYRVLFTRHSKFRPELSKIAQKTVIESFPSLYMRQDLQTLDVHLQIWIAC